MNQKPLALLELAIRASTDPGDVVWEPFGGLCSTAIAAYRLRRKCYSAELLPEYYELAKQRLRDTERSDSPDVKTTKITKTHRAKQLGALFPLAGRA